MMLHQGRIEMAEEQLRPTPEPLPWTKDTWHEQYLDIFEADRNMLFGYTSGCSYEIPVLKKIANESKTLEEMKAALLKFVQDQREFVNDVHEKDADPWHSRTYGLRTHSL